eukprot:CAMPEP_0180110820 /NCGR_PEP_ID=MMETSP0985-20121206/35265_1 /TAXON_ID=483367 /ORGANISM="non described non described, Strain CCMP 2436" /LENGTH=33 /DNA_ID= /DNA_START= /DNA_END= /DNA_ORIENTATION=
MSTAVPTRTETGNGLRSSSTVMSMRGAAAATST